MFQKKQNPMMEQTTLGDEELIKRAQEGHMEAFNGLYERHLPAVYNRVRFKVPEVDVEDVTQEVFIAAMKSLKNFGGRAKFSTWLRTLTNRRIADYYRNRGRRADEAQLGVPLSEASPTIIPNLKTADNTAEQDDRMMIREAMRKLPDHYQDVLLLRFAEGLKFREIAVTQGQSLEATKSLFRRAVSMLRNELGEYHV